MIFARILVQAASSYAIADERRKSALALIVFVLGCAAGAPAHGQGPAVILAPTNVGSSTTGTVTFSVSAMPATVLGTTQGATGLDFSLVSGSCTAISCTYTVKFAPIAPGIRRGSVTAESSNGAIIGYGLLAGVGLAPNLVSYPAPQSEVAAVDMLNDYGIYDIDVFANGNFLITSDLIDPGANVYYELAKSGSTYAVTAGAAGRTTHDPVGILIDGAGNYYGIDFHGDITSNDEYYNPGQAEKFTYLGSAYGFILNGTAVLSSNGFAGESGMDLSGNLYLSTSNSTVVKGTLQPDGSFTSSTLFSANSPFNAVVAVTVDAAGSLYIVNNDYKGNVFVAVEKYSAGTYTFQKIASNFIDPQSISVDAGGNVYVADLGHVATNTAAAAGTAVSMFTPSGSSYIQTILSTAFNSASAVHVDAYGKVYVGDTAGTSGFDGQYAKVYVIDPTGSPSVVFGDVAVGASSATQTITLLNTGNEALTFTTPAVGSSNPAIPSYFSISNASTCPQLTNSSSVQVLASGTSCTDVLKFSPTATGFQSGTLVTAGNSLYAASTQIVNLFGTGGSAPGVTGISPTFGPTGTNVTITGYGFTGATAVKFGTTAATSFTVNSATQITATAPAVTGGTTVAMTVTGPQGTSGTSTADQFTFYDKPALSSITPGTGSIAGGTTVTILGNNLAAASQVLFGNVYGTITYNTNTEIVLTTAAHAAGVVDVTVTAPEGFTTLSSSFTYVAPVMTSLGVSGFGTAAVRTEATPVTVTALDQFGNLFTGYTGTVHFTTTDTAATLPANYTFVSGDAGVHTFTGGVTLNTIGTQSITATDTATSSIKGSQPGIVVGNAIWVKNATGTLVKLYQNGSAAIIGVGTANASATKGSVAFDSTGDVWSVSSTANTLNFATKTGTGSATYSGGGLDTPVAVAVDGAGKVWVANAGNDTVSIFTNSGTAISANTGEVTTSLSNPASMAIDASGGVWIANRQSSTLTHIFGAATPIVTPLAAATASGVTSAKP